MSSLYFTFGEQFQTGELARSLSPTDEIGLAMAMAVDEPPLPWPPFAILPVLLNGQQIGVINKIRFVHGDVHYEFRSDSGNTIFSSNTVDHVLHRLSEVLGFTSPQGAPHDATVSH